MVARRDGDILFVASSTSWFALPPLTLYAATKYAVEGFAEGLRRELGRHGVRVHSIHPGPIATEFAARAAGDDPGDLEAEPARYGPGISPTYVGRAIERALVRPGTHMYAVPRVLGVTRLVKVPGVQQVADVVLTLAGERLAGIGRVIASRAAGSPEG